MSVAKASDRRLPNPLAMRGLTSNTLILLAVVWVVGVANLSFFGNVLKTYGTTPAKLPALLSLMLAFGALNVLLAGLVAFGRATKLALIFFLLLSSLTAYFMDSFGVVINDEMLNNVVQTNPAEARDLINLRLFGYLLGLGVLPAWFVGRIPLVWRGWRIELIARLRLLALALIAIVGPVLLFGGFYASFVREHKPLRSYANPAYPLYSLVKYARGRLGSKADKTIQPIGLDARIPRADPHRELVILVVGETARADHFSLNGYGRETNPLLSQEPGVISFGDFHACGTSTAVSVPCMFSLQGSNGNAEGQESLLDVVKRAGVAVLWLDNNSDSKGVALRVPYQDYRSPEVNTVCDIECRDEGMLMPLQAYIDSHPQGDILIVLHQMGNHGPAYYKRYPAAFERFKPTCQNNDLSQCTAQEIINAYDNALLYTDYFLAKTIELLKRNSDRFETALFYVSDHGESLGEGGTWLHGLPRAIAPRAQLHVPALMWFGGHHHEVDVAALRAKRNAPYSHDHLFHTVLGFFEIETAIYRPELDILTDARKGDW
ncbi:phosphoethanolamine transferase [Sulfuricystis multivorans]|uniref:phosphoethanolamine transferase n=1 Tax=Sulfuricystis multivorans TaxID=2211108 RepID=UPI0024E02345|nr:phosphoethanolamine--lipid A transferase [Sulfuricystis multivorans]